MFAIFKEALIIQITLEKINKGHYSFLSCSVILLWIIVYDPDSLRSSNFDEVQSLIFSSVIFMIKDSLKHFENTWDADYWYNKDIIQPTIIFPNYKSESSNFRFLLKFLIWKLLQESSSSYCIESFPMIPKWLNENNKSSSFFREIHALISDYAMVTVQLSVSCCVSYLSL